MSSSRCSISQRCRLPEVVEAVASGYLAFVVEHLCGLSREKFAKTTATAQLSAVVDLVDSL
jgi:hypothetical protein